MIGEAQYDPIFRLLIVFTTHLSERANARTLQAADSEMPSITKARTYVDAHIEEDVSLGKVAHAVNVSANYFRESGKKATGINFVDYVTRFASKSRSTFCLTKIVRSRRTPTTWDSNHFPSSTEASAGTSE